MIRLLIVDDQQLFREGLRMVLSTFAELEIVGEAANGVEALERAASLQPDVIIIDLRMPVLDGVETIRRLQSAPFVPRVLALTTFDDDALVFEAVRAGALGYVLKDTSAAQLAEAVHATMRGESFLQPKVASKLVSAFLQMPAPSSSPAQTTERLGLSQREVEVLRAISRGASNKEIAVELDITEGTVKNHVTHVPTKLSVGDRTQAALKARSLGLT